MEVMFFTKLCLFACLFNNINSNIMKLFLRSFILESSGFKGLLIALRNEYFFPLCGMYAVKASKNDALN